MSQESKTDLPDGDLRLIGIRADNFKRLTSVFIRPNLEGVTEIKGRNAQGKTSTIAAIQAALGDASASPDDPVRHGAEEAVVVAELGTIPEAPDVRITRTYTPGGAPKLVLERVEMDEELGEELAYKLKRPREKIDDLLPRLCFEPLKVLDLPGRDQVLAVAEILGIDLKKYDGQIEKLFDQRTGVNGEVKRLAARLPAPAEGEESLPEEEVSVTDLLAQVQAMEEDRRINKAWEREHVVLAARADEAAKALAAAAHALDEHEKKVLPPIHPDQEIEELRSSLANAENTNRAIRSRDARLQILAEHDAKKAEADDLTKRIDALKEKRAKLVLEADLPVDDLEITPEADGFLLKKVPLKEASHAEQLLTLSAIGISQRKRLRLLLVQEGSRLDPDSLEMLDAWARQNRAQIIVERTPDGRSTGIIIEDGAVLEDFRTGGE